METNRLKEMVTLGSLLLVAGSANMAQASVSAHPTEAQQNEASSARNRSQALLDRMQREPEFVCQVKTQPAAVLTAAGLSGAAAFDSEPANAADNGHAANLDCTWTCTWTCFWTGIDVTLDGD